MPCVFLGYCEGTKTYRLMCVQTKRIIKSRDVVFLEGIEKVEGVHHNKTPSKQVEHVVVDEVVNDDEFIKDANPISLTKRPAKDVEGDESTSKKISKKEFATHRKKV
jgi:hypothetical protein